MEDCGCFSLDSVDYPDISKLVCEKVNSDLSNNIKSIGILIGGTGIGMCMAANKIPNIRCALVYEPDCAILTRQHNDANVLALGARISSLAQIKLIIDMFLKTEFEEVDIKNALIKFKLFRKKNKYN